MSWNHNPWTSVPLSVIFKYHDTISPRCKYRF